MFLPTIYVSPTDETVLSEDTMFWGKDEFFAPLVHVASGGELDISSSVSFINGEYDKCTVRYEGPRKCLYNDEI